jgi:hypothetical protein
MSNWQSLPYRGSEPTDTKVSQSQPQMESKIEAVDTPAEPVVIPEDTPTEAPPSAPPVEDAPTDSHAIAMADHEDKGAAQLDHSEPEVKDLGWDEKPENIPAPLVGGLPNEDLWILVRRFNKVFVSMTSYSSKCIMLKKLCRLLLGD